MHARHCAKSNKNGMEVQAGDREGWKARNEPRHRDGRRLEARGASDPSEGTLPEGTAAPWGVSESHNSPPHTPPRNEHKLP